MEACCQSHPPQFPAYLHGGAILKGDGVSPTEALVSTITGPVGAAATEANAIKEISYDVEDTWDTDIKEKVVFVIKK